MSSSFITFTGTSPASWSYASRSSVITISFHRGHLRATYTLSWFGFSVSGGGASFPFAGFFLSRFARATANVCDTPKRYEPAAVSAALSAAAAGHRWRMTQPPLPSASHTASAQCGIIGAITSACASAHLRYSASRTPTLAVPVR